MNMNYDSYRNRVTPSGSTLVHTYPEVLDGVRQGIDPTSIDGREPEWIEDSRYTPMRTRSFPYCNILNTDLEEGVMIERMGRDIYDWKIGIPQTAIIRKVRQYNQDFLKIWQEQADGSYNHLNHWCYDHLS